MEHSQSRTIQTQQMDSADIQNLHGKVIRYGHQVQRYVGKQVVGAVGIELAGELEQLVRAVEWDTCSNRAPLAQMMQRIFAVGTTCVARLETASITLPFKKTTVEFSNLESMCASRLLEVSNIWIGTPHTSTTQCTKSCFGLCNIPYCSTD